MVGIDKKIHSGDLNGASFGRGLNGETNTPRGFTANRSSRVEDLQTTSLKNTFDLSLNNPGIDTNDQIMIADEASRTRRSLRSHSLRHLSITIRNHDPSINHSDFNKNITQEWSPSVRKQPINVSSDQ